MRSTHREMWCPEVLGVWTLPTVVGVVVGPAIAAVAPSAIFKLAFVLIAVIIVAKMWFISDRWRIADDLPGRRTMSAYGFATSAGIGVPITIAGTIGYIAAGLPHQALLPPMSLGFVPLIGVAVIAPISSWAAPWGARLAHAPRRWLEIAFGRVPVAGRREIRGEPGMTKCGASASQLS